LHGWNFAVGGGKSLETLDTSGVKTEVSRGYLLKNALFTPLVLSGFA
jgi:hypothetical protein